MEIYLQRAWTGEELETSRHCDMCRTLHIPGPVGVWTVGLGQMCEVCFSMFAGRADVVEASLPIWEEYVEARERYPEAMFSSDEELEKNDPNCEWVSEVSRDI
jgi:hypothetical protein